jgi:hypothetical protein
MKLLLSLIIILTSMITNSQINAELDLIDAYKIEMNKVTLFGNIQDYISELGLPEHLIQGKKEIDFKTADDIKNVIRKTTEFSRVQFKGMEIWSFPDLEVIPCKIDLRSFVQKLTYKNISFDRTYSIEDFRKDFPNSFSNSPKLALSFFQIATQTKLNNITHFYLHRNTLSDQKKKLLVEYTFHNNKLIYIFFTNF